MCRRNRSSEGDDQLWRDGPQHRKPVERGLLIKALEVYGPLDHFSSFTEMKCSVRIAAYRKDPKIKVGGIALIDGDFRITGFFPQSKGREVHVVVADRTLDFVDVGSGQKNHCAVRVDPNYGITHRMSFRILQEVENRPLIDRRARLRVSRLFGVVG